MGRARSGATSVLVTGATGSAGGAAVRALAGRGFDVVAASRSAPTADLPAGARGVAFAWGRSSEYPDLLDGIGGLYLVAAPLDQDTVAHLTPLINAAVEKGVEHIVLLSGTYLTGIGEAAARDQPLVAVERALADSGIGHTILRASFFMENFTTGYFRFMSEQGVIALPAGASKTAFVAGDDVGACVAEAFSRKATGTWNLTGPQALDHADVAALLSRRFGRSVRYEPISGDDYADRLVAAGLSDSDALYAVRQYEAVRAGAVSTVTEDVARLSGHAATSYPAFLGLSDDGHT